MSVGTTGEENRGQRTEDREIVSVTPLYTPTGFAVAVSVYEIQNRSKKYKKH